jgi:hypothetical protein
MQGVTQEFTQQPSLRFSVDTHFKGNSLMSGVFLGKFGGKSSLRRQSPGRGSGL